MPPMPWVNECHSNLPCTWIHFFRCAVIRWDVATSNIKPIYFLRRNKVWFWDNAVIGSFYYWRRKINSLTRSENTSNLPGSTLKFATSSTFFKSGISPHNDIVISTRLKVGKLILRVAFSKQPDKKSVNYLKIYKEMCSKRDPYVS